MYPVNGSHYLLAKENKKLTFGGLLMVNVYHQVSVILNQRVEKWLTGWLEFSDMTLYL